MHRMPGAPHLELDGPLLHIHATAVAFRLLASHIMVAAACACCMQAQLHHRGPPSIAFCASHLRLHSAHHVLSDTSKASTATCYLLHHLAKSRFSKCCTPLCRVHALQADFAGTSPCACSLHGAQPSHLLQVAPALGVVIACAMWLASLPSVRAMRKSGQLGVSLCSPKGLSQL